MRRGSRSPNVLSLVAVAALATLFGFSDLSEPRAQDARARSRLSERRDGGYFPLGIGFRWTYVVRSTANNAATRVVQVLPGEAPEARRVPAFAIQGYFGAPEGVHQIQRALSSRIVEIAPSNQKLLWYWLDAGVGEGWQMHLAPPGAGGCEDGATLTVVSRDEVVRVPAGEFREVVRIDRSNLLCADAGIESEWFAPGVGLIRRVEQSFSGPVTSELIEADLGGRRWPRPGYAASLELSASRYVNQLMPPTGPDSLPEVQGRLTVRSRSDDPVILEFGGCRSLIVEVRDGSGALVRSIPADDGGCCACDSVVRVDLAEEPLEVPFSFILSDEGGRPLADGRYSVTAIAETLGGETLRPSVRVPIEVESTY